jgi:hypothetical protein
MKQTHIIRNLDGTIKTEIIDVPDPPPEFAQINDFIDGKVVPTTTLDSVALLKAISKTLRERGVL